MDRFLKRPAPGPAVSPSRNKMPKLSDKVAMNTHKSDLLSDGRMQCQDVTCGSGPDLGQNMVSEPD